MILTKISLNEFNQLIEDRYENYDLPWIKYHILKAMSDPSFNSIQAIRRKDPEAYGILCFKPEMLTLAKTDAMLFNNEEKVYWKLVNVAYSYKIAILFADLDGKNEQGIALARSGTNLFLVRTNESYLDISRYLSNRKTK